MSTPEEKAEKYLLRVEKSGIWLAQGAVSGYELSYKEAYLAGYSAGFNAGLDTDKNMAYAEGWNEGVEEAIDRAAWPRWISVKERLPVDEGSYLVVADNHITPTGECLLLRRVNLACFTISRVRDISTGFYINSILNQSVTHWMLLPEPPKED